MERLRARDRQAGGLANGPLRRPWHSPCSQWRGGLRVRAVRRHPERRARRLRTYRGIGRSFSRGGLQAFLQAEQTVANPTFYRAERFFQRGGNLGVAQAFKIGQLDGFLLLRVQGGHERANSLATALLVELFFVFRYGYDRGHFCGLALAAALSFALQAQRVQSAISGEGEQPGNEGPAGLIVLSGVAPELEENVLGDFFGRSGLLEDAQQEAVDETRMAVVELLEGAHILLKKTVHKNRVGRQLVVRRW